MDSSYREVGSEGHLKQSVSEVMKAHLLRPGKKDASCRNRREGLEIWRLVERSAQEGLQSEMVG